MNEESLISVIVPIYNVEKYLERCIQSILQQTYQNLEIILVNDGSTDNCLSICKKYKEKDKRIQIVDKPNGGLSDARNEGINHANGAYFLFVDSDDYIRSDMIETLYDCLKNNQAEVAVCDYEKVGENQKIEWKVGEKSKGERKVFKGKEILEEYYGPLYLVLTVAWNKLYKRELFEKERYPLGKLHEDEFLTYKLLYRAKKIVYIKEKMYYYVQRQNGITKSKLNIKRYDRVKGIEERLQFLFQQQKKELYQKASYILLREAINFYLQYKEVCPQQKEEISYLKNEYKRMCRIYGDYLSKRKKAIIWFYFHFPKVYLYYCKKRRGKEEK